MGFIHKFDNQIEKEFLDSYIEKSLGVIRIGYFLCVFLYGIFGMLDVWIVPETKNIAWLIRFPIVIPCVVFIIIISYTDFFKRYNQVLLVVSSAIVGLGIVFMIAYSKPTELGYKFYYSGLVLVLIWIYTLIRLRFWNSVISGLIITLGYEIIAIFVQHLTSGGIESGNMLIFINNNFFFLSANIIGLFASFHIEKLHRSDFLQKRTILLKNEEQKKLNADKDRFLSILAHDLRNPFNSLLGFSELLLKNLHKYDIEKIEKQLTYIYQTAHETYNLLEDLLLWSKAQSGKLTLEPQKIVFDEIYDEIISKMKSQAAAKGISINCFETEKTILLADLNMLKTVLRNLISNAIKFTNKNGHIIIYTEKGHKSATVIVSDNGIGIEKGNQSKLWDFTKPFSTRGTAHEKGTGFGLLVCKEFVEKHSGKIWVESELGKGSDFKFTMPLCNE